MNSEELVNQLRNFMDDSKTAYIENMNKTQKQIESLIVKINQENQLKKYSANSSHYNESIIAESESKSKDLTIDYRSKDQIGIIRISEELFAKDVAFISSVFKNDCINIQQDKNSKTYYASVPKQVIKIQAEVSNLIKNNNNMYEVNTIIDFFILQILTLEYYFKVSNTDKTQAIAKQKVLEEEIKELHSNPKINNNNQNKAQFEIFETEINKIKNMLIQRSKEFSDNESKKIASKTDNIIEELLHQNKSLMELNIKMKTFINSLVSSYKNNNEEQLNKLLEELMDTNFDFVDNKQSMYSKQNTNDEYGNSTDDNNNNYYGIINPNVSSGTLNKKSSVDDLRSVQRNKSFKTDFVDKVINEFDNLLGGQSKKLDKFFEKTGEPKRKMSSSVTPQRRFTGTGEKNYVEWKPANNWQDGLRSDGARSEEKLKLIPATIKDSDLHVLATQAKAKVRQSIVLQSPNFTDISQTSPQKMNHQASERIINISQMSEFGEDYKHDYNFKSGGVQGFTSSPSKKSNNSKKEKASEKHKRE